MRKWGKRESKAGGSNSGADRDGGLQENLLSSNDEFCSECGEQHLEGMGSKFCGNCGAPRTSSANVPSPRSTDTDPKDSEVGAAKEDEPVKASNGAHASTTMWAR